MEVVRQSNQRSAMTAQEQNQTARSIVEAYCDAWMAGDVLAVLGFYHDDLELTWPGRNHLAGVHQGQAASVEALLKLQELTGRQPLEVLDIAQGEKLVIATVIERWTDPANDARSVDLRRVLEFTVTDGQLRTCRVYESDQHIIDEWIG